MRENCTYGLKRGKESKGCILPSAFFFYSTGFVVFINHPAERGTLEFVAILRKP